MSDQPDKLAQIRKRHERESALYPHLSDGEYVAHQDRGWLIARIDVLTTALTDIRDRDTDCGCDHTTEDCCALVPSLSYFCPHCFAALLLQKLQDWQ